MVVDQQDGNHLPVSFVRFDGDHALAAAFLNRVLIDRGSFTVSVLGGGKQGLTMAQYLHADDPVGRGQPHSSYASGNPSGGSDI